MKLKILFFTIAMLLTTITEAGVSVGESLPSFKLTKLTGEETLSNISLNGKVTLIDFWASWCVPCRASLPMLQGLHKEGINVVSVTIDKDPQKALSFLRKYDVPYDAYHDTKAELAAQLGLPTMPSSYLIDQSGKVIKIYAGFNKADEFTIRSDIKKANETRKVNDLKKTSENKRVMTQ